MGLVIIDSEIPQCHNPLMQSASLTINLIAMTRKNIRNIIWAIAGAFAIYSLIAGAYHQLITASLIFAFGAVQDEEDKS